MTSIAVKRLITQGKNKGKVETQVPERVDGAYWVQVPVYDEKEMERLVLKEGCAVRMRGDVTGQFNLKKAK